MFMNPHSKTAQINLSEESTEVKSLKEELYLKYVKLIHLIYIEIYMKYDCISYFSQDFFP